MNSDMYLIMDVTYCYGITEDVSVICYICFGLPSLSCELIPPQCGFSFEIQVLENQFRMDRLIPRRSLIPSARHLIEKKDSSLVL